MAARFLIVDAHSVIFSWPELGAMHHRRMILAREALIKALTEYQDISGVRVVAVFDGQGDKASETSEPGGIQVFYSGQGQTADDVIERLAAAYGREFELTVATNDLAEQDTVSGFGAVCISTDRLHEMLEVARSDFQRELKRLRRRK
jgi:predicted RNA-binding protein with PIN domain